MVPSPVVWTGSVRETIEAANHLQEGKWELAETQRGSVGSGRQWVPQPCRLPPARPAGQPIDLLPFLLVAPPSEVKGAGGVPGVGWEGRLVGDFLGSFWGQ